MDNRSDGGGIAIAIGLVLVVILLLLGGGVGAYYFVQRQQMTMMMHVERAQLAEEHARMVAERARADAAVAAANAAQAASLGNDSPSVPADATKTAVESILRTQEEAWNRADLEAFMEHYWKSDELTFSSGGKSTRGWTDTLTRYRERYPGSEKMGRLKLSGLEISPLGDSAALVLGQWSVERESEPVSGNFSLVVRKVDDRWLIIHDHTSRLAE